MADIASSKFREVVTKQILVWKEIWGLKLGVAGKWVYFCDNAVSLSSVKNRTICLWYVEVSV